MRLAPLLLGFVLAGCDSGLGRVLGLDAPVERSEPALVPPPPAPAPDPAPNPAPAPAPEPTFVAGVQHPYFPMTPGTLRVYEGTSGGMHRRDEVTVLAETDEIAGVACTAFRQEVFLDGELAEVTTEWFAQDGDGNVWKFGEETVELDGELFRPTEDSWEAGVDGMEPWIVLAAAPRVGDVYVGNLPDGQDVMEVVSLNATAEVPAGAFQDCMEVEENPDDPDDADLIIFAPSVGLVSEESIDGRIDLVSID